jgi:hypothetical protein
MFGLNLFDLSRFTETTTILWLRFIGIILAVLGGYIATQQQSIWMKVIGYIIGIIGLGSLVVYLLFGTQIARSLSKTCVYCPTQPVKVLISKGIKGTLPNIAPLPDKDTFNHTAIYYCILNQILPSGSNSYCSIVHRDDLYDIVVDSNTGELGIRMLPDNTQITYLGKIPLQTFCQIAVTENEKEINVFVNGIPRGAVIRKNLPPTTAMRTQYIFNQSGLVQSGLIYQVQIYEGVFTEEELMNANERMTIQYENDSTFQQTKLPTSQPMSFVVIFVMVQIQDLRLVHFHQEQNIHGINDHLSIH